MPEATMRDEHSDPHLFGIAKIDDPDTLRQMLAGWVPGFDDCMGPQPAAGVDVHGDPFLLKPGDAVDNLAYPVRVINCLTLPPSMVKPASEARPYRR